MASASPAPGLIDTDILIDATRGVAAAAAFLASQQSAVGIRISVISAMELVAGCRNATDLSAVQQFLQQIVILPITEAASLNAHQLMNGFFLSHGLLIPDAMIAATALDSGLSLFTRNARHFNMIPGLTSVQPY